MQGNIEVNHLVSFKTHFGCPRTASSQLQVQGSVSREWNECGMFFPWEILSVVPLDTWFSVYCSRTPLETENWFPIGAGWGWGWTCPFPWWTWRGFKAHFCVLQATQASDLMVVHPANQFLYEELLFYWRIICEQIIMAVFPCLP